MPLNISNINETDNNYNNNNSLFGMNNNYNNNLFNNNPNQIYYTESPDFSWKKKLRIDAAGQIYYDNNNINNSISIFSSKYNELFSSFEYYNKKITSLLNNINANTNNTTGGLFGNINTYEENKDLFGSNIPNQKSQGLFDINNINQSNGGLFGIIQNKQEKINLFGN